MTNVDYSRVAVEQCIECEKDKEATVVVWKTAGLLSADSIRGESLDDGDLFDAPVDKRTSDEISCAEGVEIRLPYVYGGGSINPSSASSASDALDKRMIHPLHLLSVHLAALTKPHNGRWVT